MSCDEASPEVKEQIETLYNSSIEHIRDLKARQWEVTKWVLAANVVLLFPIVTGETADAAAGNSVLLAIAALSLLLGALGGWTIYRTQCSLRDTRQQQRNWRRAHPELAKADRIGKVDPEPETGRSSLGYDYPIWLLMLGIVAASAVATIWAAIAAWACP